MSRMNLNINFRPLAYLLTTCGMHPNPLYRLNADYPEAFQLPFGKIYSIFNPKWIFMGALFIFEIGSLICGVSSSSIVLIVGRAIAGVGAAGIFSGALLIIALSTPMEKRPAYQSIMGGMFGIASVAGPLVRRLFCLSQ